MDVAPGSESFRRMSRHFAGLGRVYLFTIALLGFLLVLNFYIINTVVKTQSKSIQLTRLIAQQQTNFNLAAQVVDVSIKLQRRGAITEQLQQKAHRKLKSIRDSIRQNEAEISVLITQISNNLLVGGAEALLREPVLSLKDDTHNLLEKLDSLTASDPHLIDWRFSLWSPLYLSLSPEGKLSKSIARAASAMFLALATYERRLSILHASLLGITFFIILFEGLLIFRPLLKRFNADRDLVVLEHEKLTYLAAHDDLTNLSNRRDFSERIIDNLDWEQEEAFALFLVDLDHFKSVNDIHGTVTGDQMLKVVASRIASWCQSDWQPFRLAGDEFAVFVPGEFSKQALLDAANELIGLISDPMRLDNTMLTIGASIGIANSNATMRFTPSQLLTHADIALRQAKLKEQKGVVIFGDRESVQYVQRMEQGEHVLHALERGDLHPYYQPIIEVSSKKIVGMEALLRWDTPSGVIGPGEFLPVLEECGLMKEATEKLMEYVGSDYASCVAAGVDPGYMSVNIPYPVLIDQQMPASFGKYLNAERYEWLQIEVLETAMLHRNTDVIRENLKKFTDRGARIALDDFGTGYASLSHFRNFFCNTVKIDHSFVRDILHDTSAQLIVKGLVDLATGLGMKVIAEGVEHQEQSDLLRVWGVQYIQGDLYGRASPLKEIIRTLSQQAQASRR